MSFNDNAYLARVSEQSLSSCEGELLKAVKLVKSLRVCSGCFPADCVKVFEIKKFLRSIPTWFPRTWWDSCAILSSSNEGISPRYRANSRCDPLLDFARISSYVVNSRQYGKTSGPWMRAYTIHGGRKKEGEGLFVSLPVSGETFPRKERILLRNYVLRLQRSASASSPRRKHKIARHQPVTVSSKQFEVSSARHVFPESFAESRAIFCH